MPPEKINRQQLEEEFRAELGRVVDLINALSPHCGTLEEMVGVCELAATNDSQLRIVMGLAVTNTQQAKR